MALLPILTANASYGTPMDRKPKVRNVKFGDGYEENAPDGINNDPRSFSVTFGKRSNDEIADIATFIEQKAKLAQPFLWKPFPPFDTVGIFICRDWSFTADEFNSNAIHATLDELFMAQDVLDTPIPADLPASSGALKATSVLELPAFAPAITPLTNAANYPVGSRVAIKIDHGDDPDLPGFRTAGYFNEEDGLQLNIGAATIVSLDPGAHLWTLVRMIAFHDYYAHSFMFKAIYPRTVGAYNSLP